MNFIKFLFEVWKSGSANTLISTNRSVIVLVLVQQSLQRAGSGTEAPRLTGLVGRGEKRPGPAGRGEQGVGLARLAGLAGLVGLTHTGPLGLLAPTGRDRTGREALAAPPTQNTLHRGETLRDQAAPPPVTAAPDRGKQAATGSRPGRAGREGKTKRAAARWNGGRAVVQRSQASRR